MVDPDDRDAHRQGAVGGLTRDPARHAGARTARQSVLVAARRSASPPSTWRSERRYWPVSPARVPHVRYLVVCAWRLRARP